jgi:hypothetical protein
MSRARKQDLIHCPQCGRLESEKVALAEGWQVCLEREDLFCSDKCHEGYHERERSQV